MSVDTLQHIADVWILLEEHPHALACQGLIVDN
jgi:hypothetical protein